MSTARHACALTSASSVKSIQGHSRALRRRAAAANIVYGANIPAPLATPRDRSENPGVGGSIPSLPTSFLGTHRTLSSGNSYCLV